jgi:SpoVK/Ycf46/Vps4 family AAA+-type ATPase
MFRYIACTVLTRCCGRPAGFTGADIQNLMNEAAILAARRNLKEVSKEEIADALERIVAGPEKKGAVVSEPKKRLVAYHEVRSFALATALSSALHMPCCFAACCTSVTKQGCSCAGLRLCRWHVRSYKS